MREQQSIFFRGFAYSLLNYSDKLRLSWCNSVAYSQWRFHRARSTTQKAASARLSSSLVSLDVRLVQKELRLYFSRYWELVAVSCLNYDSQVWRMCWYSIQRRRKWKWYLYTRKWDCWIKRTVNGHSAVGRHSGVKKSAIRFMTEMRMSREEALRPLLHPVQKFLVELTWPLAGKKRNMLFVYGWKKRHRRDCQSLYPFEQICIMWK